ncbi:MAG: nucleotidyltransferase family protein, partial [Anaerolineales bacterium]|nr:nucleotidyltransferase family protein [Anaerolineales bacterium]
EAALRLNELESVLAVLNEAAVDFVVMKGITVAQAAYPYAGARFSSDIDLWILPEASGHASQQLEGIGYRRLGSPLRPTDYKLRYGGVIKLGGNVSQGQGMIEIQWPAIRGEWVRRVSRIDHEAIWARRNPFPVGGQRAWMMSPEDLLIHLSVHAGINHQLAIWLAALLDLHLLISNTPAFNWRVVVERACAWQLRSLLWTVLGTTQHLFGTSISASFFGDLRPPRLRRELLASLDPVEWLIFEEGERQLNHRRFLIQLALIDRPHDGLRLMRHALFPDAEWLRLRYDATTTRQLWNERLRHPLRVLLRAEV